MANVVLGVSGSVAAYRAADVARELMRDGHTVRVCLTDAAQNFVTPALFEALTGNPCLIDTFEEPERGRMAHIDWARSADLILVAPATANTIARLAHGIGDDMLTTLVLASEAPLLVAPAMNPHMYADLAFRTALTMLEARATGIISPQEGDVACGEHGQGKLATVGTLVAAARQVLKRSQLLAGKRVLITSGPTQEPIDAVRYITNRSSGKMGSALARAALLMGAEVTVIAGPQRAILPIDAQIIRVQTALEMHAAALREAPQADLMIGAAAVADYRLETPVPGKLRRDGSNLRLELVPNPDVIAAAAAICPGKVVGFAAEPSSDPTVAREKLRRKGLFAIAANDVSGDGIGFDADANLLQVHFADGRAASSGLQSKLGCALWLLEQVTA